MEHFLQTWGYLALFGATMISSMCIPIGSELTIAYAGALASSRLATSGHHHLNLALVIIVATVGELVGSIIAYSLGRVGGRPLVDRFGKYLLLTKRDLDRAERWLDGRGEIAALFGRFVPLVRSFVSIAAGLGEMAVGKFLLFSAIGCAIWCTAFASIGYSLGSSWHRVVTAFGYVGYVAVLLVALVVAVAIWHRIRTLRSERDSDGRAFSPSSPYRDAPELDGGQPPVAPLNHTGPPALSAHNLTTIAERDSPMPSTIS